MKASTTLISLAAITSAMASPTPQSSPPGVFEVSIEFIGVDAAQNYTLNFPANDTPVTINNSLPVAEIYSNGGGFCSFSGAKGANPVITGAVAGQTVPVSPPQVILWGACDTA